MVLGSSVGSPVGEPVVVPSHGMPDLSREGPFDVHQDASESEATPQVLDNFPGCQYRMTSYDDDVDRSDLSPAYGIHLHDPRLLEYVGAPESARLLSRSPEYWLHHMGRDRTMSAALQLQHDAGLILSNLQVLGQFVSSLNRMSSEVMRVALHGCHGIAPTVAPVVIFMQRLYDVLGLLSGSSEVNNTKLNSTNIDLLTLCDNVPSALLCDCCFIVASLRLVLVVWVSFLGIPVFLGMVVYMFPVYLCVFQQLLGKFGIWRVFSGLPPCEG